MTLYLLFNHTLTPDQQKDVIETLNIDEFVYLPDELIDIWSNIPPNLEHLNEFIAPVENYIKANLKPNDYILIQGDFGATYHMVNVAKSLELIPLYATTERKSVEEIQQDGTVKKTALFAHKRFRRYE